MLARLPKTVKSLLVRSFSTEIAAKPTIQPLQYRKPREVWVENLDTIEKTNLELLKLDPEVFAANPRIDIIHQNVRWQQMYRYVSFAHAKARFEVRGGGRKPWPQKGLGRARHGSIRSPLFKGGGVAHGPVSPNPHFYMLPFFQRVHGLMSTLSVKLAQSDLIVVSNFDLPNDDQSFFEELVKARMWGPSVLFVDTNDVMPRNITVATDNVKQFNLMPVYGLNVYSMLKHETVVFTKEAIQLVEKKLLGHLQRTNCFDLITKFKVNQV